MKILLKSRKNLYYYIIIVATFIIIFINSMASPIYDISLLNDDAHLFYTIGRGMKEGLKPYIDLFDHKGLYIFFINYLASLIPYRHIGLFLIQFIFLCINAVLIYKIVKNYVSDISSCFCSLMIVSLQTSYFFSYGAMQLETLMTTFLIAGYYIGYKYIKNIEENPSHPYHYMFLQGILAGIIFFTKPNLVIPWIFYAIFVLIVHIKHKLYKQLFVNIIFGCLGIVIAFLPVLIYSLANNCFYEMIWATFLFSMQYMGNGAFEIYDSVQKIIYTYVINYSLFMVMIVLSALIVDRNINISKKNASIYMFFLFVSLISIFITGRPYLYYANASLIFIVPLIVYTFNFLEKKFLKIDNKKIYVSFSLFIILMLSVIIGVGTTYKKQKHLLSSANVIREVFDQNFKTEKRKKDAKVFGIGASHFVFNSLDVLPRERYFFTPKINYDTMPSLYEEIYDYIQSKDSEMIVVCLNEVLVRNKYITNKYFDLLGKTYYLISDKLGLYIYKKK